MSIYYPAGCDAQIPDHVCDPCEVIEQGRVRSVAFIKNTVAFIDPSNPTEWQNYFKQGLIHIIPATKGTFDGGAEVETPGYGDQVTRLTGYNFTLTYQDPNFKKNCNFYNIIKNSRQYTVAFRTSTQILMVNATVQIIPKVPITDDVNSEVVWEVVVKWSDNDVPCPYDAPPTIFDKCVVND